MVPMSDHRSYLNVVRAWLGNVLTILSVLGSKLLLKSNLLHHHVRILRVNRRSRARG